MSRERRTIPVVGDHSTANACPLAPPQHASVQTRALHRACLILGGIRQLSEHLGVSEAEVRAWLKGEQPTPETIFHAAVEVLLLNTMGPRSPN